MKKVLMSLLGILLANLAFAQETKPAGDEIDMTAITQKVLEYGVPKAAEVDALLVIAQDYYKAKNWDKAIEAYNEYAYKANWLANLLSQCLEPYYSASYDDREHFPYSILKPMVPIEKKSNFYKEQRNIAYEKIGMAYYYNGDIENAISYLYKALDLFELDSGQLIDWKEAQEAMLSIVGVTLD